MLSQVPALMRQRINRLLANCSLVVWHLKQALSRGEWTCGWEQWPGKPQFAVVRMWYDGYRNVLHIGPFWVECDY